MILVFHQSKEGDVSSLHLFHILRILLIQFQHALLLHHRPDYDSCSHYCDTQHPFSCVNPTTKEEHQQIGSLNRVSYVSISSVRLQFLSAYRSVGLVGHILFCQDLTEGPRHQDLVSELPQGCGQQKQPYDFQGQADPQGNGKQMDAGRFEMSEDEPKGESTDDIEDVSLIEHIVLPFLFPAHLEQKRGHSRMLDPEQQVEGSVLEVVRFCGSCRGHRWIGHEGKGISVVDEEVEAKQEQDELHENQYQHNDAMERSESYGQLFRRHSIYLQLLNEQVTEKNSLKNCEKENSRKFRCLLTLGSKIFLQKACLGTNFSYFATSLHLKAAMLCLYCLFAFLKVYSPFFCLDDQEISQIRTDRLTGFY